ncbi:Protein CONSERVED IN THE GREEN LINEAGE AND DIATOMS 27 [Vigna angularis]|nr:Protein CONSERVED IN THE GREEN LINEAGE AND DIATOMS 27 [Vigna angularis]
MAATSTRISPLPSRRSRLTLSPIPLFRIPTTTLTTSFISFSSTSNSNNNAPQTDCPVPLEQQPINEYHSLSTSFPFSWAALDAVEYASRLLVTGTSFALLIGLPVAWFGSAGAQAEPLKRLLCAASSGLFAVTLAVVRMYLGWAYVGNRLLSATVEYEETGWYDGQIWVKTAEVLARDRLLGSFSVKPVLSRLKITLVSLATSLLVCAIILINIDGNQNLTSKEPRVRVVPGVYNDDSARLFEPDAFRDESELQ